MSEPDAGPDPTRLVADADVLAADLLVGGDARAALDRVRSHSWLSLVVSEPLLDDAEAVVADLADPDLAADWRAKAAALGERVDHPAGDHPALACALRGGAAHVLTFDESLLSPAANAAIKPHVETSLKRPSSFVALFNPADFYAATVGGEYPGPDRDPRA